jgi:hypothetical protein
MDRHGADASRRDPVAGTDRGDRGPGGGEYDVPAWREPFQNMTDQGVDDLYDMMIGDDEGWIDKLKNWRNYVAAAVPGGGTFKFLMKKWLRAERNRRAQDRMGGLHPTHFRGPDGVVDMDAYRAAMGGIPADSGYVYEYGPRAGQPATYMLQPPDTPEWLQPDYNTNMVDNLLNTGYANGRNPAQGHFDRHGRNIGGAYRMSQMPSFGNTGGWQTDGQGGYHWSRDGFHRRHQA